jgi:hypothetical protein
MGHFAIEGSALRRITLGEKLGQGAAGEVYRLEGNTKFVFKKYRNLKIAKQHEPKVRAMMTDPPSSIVHKAAGKEYVQIAWPSGIVRDDDGRFEGFLMPFVDFHRSVELQLLLQRVTREKARLNEGYRYRITAAANLSAMMAGLHARGHHMIDMKPVNLRVYRNVMFVAVVDCDGFSIKGNEGRFPATMWTPDYIAPEYKDRRPEDCGEYQDRFALAVIVFQLLNNGVHPFQGRPAPGADVPPDLQSRVFRGLYSYGKRRHREQAPALASIHDYLEDKTREFFERAFVGGGRPSAREWCEHLRGLLDPGRALLRPCSTQRGEHEHFSKGCGFCMLDGLTGRGQQGTRAPNQPANMPSPPRKQTPGITTTSQRNWVRRHPVLSCFAAAFSIYLILQAGWPQQAPRTSLPTRAATRDEGRIELSSEWWYAKPGARVRASPSTTSAIRDTLPGGTRVLVTGRVRGTEWFRVEASGGSIKGYMAQSVLYPNAPGFVDHDSDPWEDVPSPKRRHVLRTPEEHAPSNVGILGHVLELNEEFGYVVFELRAGSTVRLSDIVHLAAPSGLVAMRVYSIEGSRVTALPSAPPGVGSIGAAVIAVGRPPVAPRADSGANR